MTVSLVITTYNRSRLLRKSLDRLANLTHPDELIVVDDGGTDDCIEVCDHAERNGLPVRRVYNNRPGESNCCQARNVALRLAKGDDILVSEPEVMFLTDIVAQMRVARLEQPKHVLYGWTWHENREGGGTVDSEKIGHFPYYTLYRKDWLMAVGGWDEGFEGSWGWDDVDLNGRLAQAGHNQFRVEECVALHQWHPSRIELAVENEARSRAKVWPDDIVANRGREWGRIK